MSRARKTAFGVLVVAMLALTTTARAETVYDAQSLGAGTPVGINSIGAVLLDDNTVIGPDGTRYPESIPAGWETWNLYGLTDPLPTAPLGLVWGAVGRANDSALVVWNVGGAMTVVSGVALLAPYGDGWMYAYTHTAGAPAGYYHVFALQMEHPEVRVEAAAVLGHPNVASFYAVTNALDRFAQGPHHGEDGKMVLVVLDEAGTSASALPVLWDAPSGATTVMGAGETTHAMNLSGEVIGIGPTGDYFYAASATAARTSIPTTPTGATWHPTQISNGGWVVGYRLDSGISGSEGIFNSESNVIGLRAPSVVAWNARDGRIRDLTADIASAGGLGAFPLAVSDDGTVFGHMWMGTIFSPESINWFHAFAWDAEHGFVDLTPSADSPWNGGVRIMAVNPHKTGKVFYTDYYDPSGSSRSYAWQRIDGIPQYSVLPVSLDPVGNLDRGNGIEQALITADYGSQYTNVLGQFVSTNGTVAVVTPRGITQAGTNVAVQPDSNTSITFVGIDRPGETSVVAYDINDPQRPSVPPDFKLAGDVINISTTAELTPGLQIQLALHYDDGGMTPTEEDSILLLHFVNGDWVDVTEHSRPGGYLDTVHNIIYGVTPSFSPFAIVRRLDTTPPVIADKDDIHADATSTLGATVTFTAPAANDDTAGSVAVACVPASGTLFPVGVTTVTCTASDTHQNTATSTFDVVVRIDPRYLKGAVADSLNTLIATSDKKTVKKLLKAIREIEDSLAPALWVDDFHLTKKGSEVFKEESEAAAQLLAIENPPALVTQALLSLVEADRVLEATALVDATAANPTSTHLATATTEMGLGAASKDSGAYGDAIRHYRKAWKSAMKALGLL